MQPVLVVKGKRIEGVTLLAECTAEQATTIRVLNDALATEVIAILRYQRHYFMTAGIGARYVKATFLQHVTEERAHADLLVERIVQLGGKAELSPERLLKRSQAEDVEGESLLQMITADLTAERVAIESYRDMITAIDSDDPATQQVLARILEQEEVHAESLARLLRE